VPFSNQDLSALLEQSREANASKSITGMLLYRRGRFIQFLEGPEREVRDLLARIRQDPRHIDVSVLIEGKSRERQFSDWTMGYEPFVEPEESLPEGFRDTFDDLDSAEQPDVVVRATQQLILWFRVRSNRRDARG
jgi:hypothetical protein